MFSYSESVEAFYKPKDGPGEPGPYKSDSPKGARLGRRPVQSNSAADQVAQEFFDAGFLARVVLLRNGTGLLAQLQTKDIFLQ